MSTAPQQLKKSQNKKNSTGYASLNVKDEWLALLLYVWKV
jgi:hypothetical protein